MTGVQYAVEPHIPPDVLFAYSLPTGRSLTCQARRSFHHGPAQMVRFASGSFAALCSWRQGLIGLNRCYHSSRETLNGWAIVRSWNLPRRRLGPRFTYATEKRPRVPSRAHA